MTKEIEEKVKAWYKNWCKETGRSGGVLIGSSIRELLQSFAEQKYAYDNDVYAGDGRVIEAERKAFISGLEQPLSDLLTPSADVQEQIEAYIKKNEADGIGPELRDAIHFAMNLAGASSLQAENERLRSFLQDIVTEQEPQTETSLCLWYKGVKALAKQHLEPNNPNPAG